MEGPSRVNGPEDPESGMIPKAVKQIYESAKCLEAKGWKYEMDAQFLEIYNENLRDLLGNSEVVKHEIRHDKGKTQVTDATIGKIN